MSVFLCPIARTARVLAANTIKHALGALNHLRFAYGECIIIRGGEIAVNSKSFDSTNPIYIFAKFCYTSFGNSKNAVTNSFVAITNGFLLLLTAVLLLLTAVMLL